MTTTARPQQRYDHRLRDLVQRTRDVTIATDLGVPRSTARGWLGKAQKVVASLDVTGLRALELQQEVLALRRRVKKLTALLRLALALLRSSGFTLTHERLPDGRVKIRILRAVDRAREFVPLRALLRFLQLSPSRFHAWRRLQIACALDNQSSCPYRNNMSSNFDGVILRGFPLGAENTAGVNPSQGSSRLDSHDAGCELKWVKPKQSSAATVWLRTARREVCLTVFPAESVLLKYCDELTRRR